jgi:anti-anti-sigma factor
MAIDRPLTIERVPGNAPGTVILRLTGSLILNNVLSLRAEFRNAEPPRVTILDLTGVFFMDSAEMSEIINHEVYCRDRRVRLILAGVTERVLSMLQVTRLDLVLTLAVNVEEAEARA